MERPFLAVGEDDDDVAPVADVEGRGRKEVEEVDDDVSLVTVVSELPGSTEVVGSPASGTVYLHGVHDNL